MMTATWTPIALPILEIRKELADVDTYVLEAPADYRFQPGQFNMVYVPGFGEAAISISSNPQTPTRLEHTVRAVGNVTRAMKRYEAGQQLLLRGPFGSSWPVDACLSTDLVIACGGLGLAPLRPVIYDVINRREDFGKVWLLYGSRSPKDLLFPHEYSAWRQAGIEVEVIVDQADEKWRGPIGVVTQLMGKLNWNPATTRVMTCGPEVMMRFVAFEAITRKIPAENIFVSMERNMNCAIGHCGHCQLGPTFVCKDGPVFPYSVMEPFMHVEDL